MFALPSSNAGTYALWAAGLVALLAFTAGLYTRVATVTAWALLVSLHNRNVLVLSGGDRIVELLLFTSLFTRLNEEWSLDALRSGATAGLVPALGLRFLQLEIALLYFFTARLKLSGAWRGGEGVWLSLQHLGFLRPPGQLVLAAPALSQAVNWAVMLFEFAIPFLLFSPWARRRTVPLGVALSIAVQLGIFATMRVGFFTAAMLVVNVLWLEPQMADSVAPNRAAVAKACALAVMMGLMSWDFVIGKRVPMPKPLRAVQQALSLEELFELFGVTYPIWTMKAVGTRQDGTDFELLRELAPGLQPEVGWFYDRWMKVGYGVRNLDPEAFGQWLCREWRRRQGEPLSKVVVTLLSHQPVHIGESVPPDIAEVLWAGGCAAAHSR